jgi:mxaA protein
MRTPAFFAILLAAMAIDAHAAGDDITVDVSLRDTGYMLGDLIDERVEIRLPASMRIDPESLPLTGRVTPWLEVRRTDLWPREASGTQQLVVTYQIFAESEEAARAALPEFSLRVRDGTDVRSVIVPSRSFLLSPALPPALTDEDRELRPSPMPMFLPIAQDVAGALASLVVALVCGAYLLWRYDRLPFLPRAPGPLARTWRRWRRGFRNLSSDQHAALLRDMHSALSRSAGETLYPSTLERLFERAPFLVPLRERIGHVFAASWSSFYEQAEQTPPSAASVLALLHEAADRERGVPC